MIKQLLVMILGLAISFLSAGESVQTSAELRYRFESSGKDFNDDSRLNNFSLLRTRLHVKFNPITGISGFIQFQGGTAIFMPGAIFKEKQGQDNALFFYLLSQFKL